MFKELQFLIEHWTTHLSKKVCLEYYQSLYGLCASLRWYREGWMVRLTSTEGGMITKMDLVTLILSFGSVGGFFFVACFLQIFHSKTWTLVKCSLVGEEWQPFKLLNAQFHFFSFTERSNEITINIASFNLQK